jgi:branched-chain amino acid transport system substrate-binding protein
MQMKKALNKVAIALLALSFAFIAGGAKISVAAPDTVKVGMPIPLSGPGAAIGQRFQKAAEMAIDDLNKIADGKMKFVPVVLDSRCSPDGAQTAAKKLILEDNVNVLVGELCGDATLAIKDLAGQYKVPLVVPDSSAINITEKGNPYTFRIMPNEVQQHVTLARVAVNHFKQKKFVVAYEQSSSGIGAGKAFIQEATRLGATILEEIALDRSSADYSAVVTHIKALKPDAINLTLLLDPAVRFMKTLHEQGVKVPVYHSVWWPYPLFEHLSGPASEGIVRELFYIDSSDYPAAADFTKQFKAKYPGETPDFNHAQFYAAVRLAGEMAIKNGADREAIRKGLAAIKDYKSAIGPLKFDEKGQSVMTTENIIFIQTKKNGAVQILDKLPEFDKKNILGL